MSKLLAAPPIGGGEPLLFVRALRTALAPLPWAWAWAIHEEGRPEPVRRSLRRYGSAEDAWAGGRAVLDRLPPSPIKAAAGRYPAPD
jgi:hypothetical protein